MACAYAMHFAVSGVISTSRLCLSRDERSNQIAKSLSERIRWNKTLLPVTQECLLCDVCQLTQLLT